MLIVQKPHDTLERDASPGPNQRLILARKRMHWSQTEAARHVGVGLETFSRWERGIQEPHGYNLDQLCQVFGASAEELGYVFEAEPENTMIAPEGQETPVKGTLIRLTSEQVGALLALLGDDAVKKPFDPTKRKTLEEIAAILGTAAAVPFALADPEPWERLFLAQVKPSVLNEETTSNFEALLRTCWQISNSGELAVAEALLPSFLPELVQIAPYQLEAASLAARGLHLHSILTAHKLQLADKVVLSTQAVDMAKKSNDYNVLCTTLTELAVAHRYNGDVDSALKVCLENIHSCEYVTSPLVCSRAYAEAALNFALHGRYREAQFYLDYAYESFPSKPQEDMSFWYADAGSYTLLLRDLLVKVEMGNYQHIWDSATAMLQHSQGVPERNRIEIVNHLGRAALLENDLDRYVTYLKDGLAGAIALKSRKRFSEAITIFQEVPGTWHKEPALSDIIEQYSLQSVTR